MDDKIRVILQCMRIQAETYDKIESLEQFLSSDKDGDLNTEDTILNHYNIPKHTYDHTLEWEDQANDVFLRDHYYELIYDTSVGQMTFDELDYYLTHEDEINKEMSKLYPNEDGDGWSISSDVADVTDVIVDVIAEMRKEKS